MKADRELFPIMANEIKGSLRPLPTGFLPMDEAMKRDDAFITTAKEQGFRL